MEIRNKTEEKLKKLLKKLRAALSSQQNANAIQRIIQELRIYQIEQEVRNLELGDARRQLAEARERYVELYDFAPVAYVTFDRQARITDLNPAAAELFGLEREHIINQPISRWLSEQDTQNFLRHLYQVSFSRKKLIAEIKLKRSDGKLLFVSLESVAVRDKDGVATHCQTAIVDLAGWKRAGEQWRFIKDDPRLRIDERSMQLATAGKDLLAEIKRHSQVNEKQKQASIVFDNTEDGIIVMDASFNIINVNRSFCDKTGYDSDNLLGKNPRILVTSRTDDKYFQNMLEALKEKGHWKGEIWFRNRNTKRLPAWVNINSVTDEKGRVTHHVAIVTDITLLKENEMRLEHLAYHDVLTGLPNRLHFIANLEQALKRALRRKRRLALLLLDLDKFKQVNDSMGHATGDTLLKIMAERLQDAVRHEDTVARLGGDEFIVILEDITQFEDAGYIADKILNVVEKPIMLNNRKIITRTSIGIGIFPDDAEDVDTLAKTADSAMYRAKKKGGHCYEFYTRDLSRRTAENLSLEAELRIALKEGQFEVYYQPQITLSSDTVVGMEALIRWNHPSKGLLTPDRFMQVAEESGLVDEIDEWVLNTACRQVSSWQRAKCAPIRISINLAGRTLNHDHSIVEKVEKALASSGLAASSLELDIPEYVLQNNGKNLEILHALKSLGVNLSIDDFGKGLSSLATLKQFPIDTIKINRSFLDAIPGSADDTALARALIAIGQNLRLKVTAAGVCSLEQMDFLKNHGCDEMQGFYFSEPVPFDLVMNFISSDDRVH